MEQAKALNIIGPKIREVREHCGLTQDQMAAKCQILGFDLTRRNTGKNREPSPGSFPTMRFRTLRRL